MFADVVVVRLVEAELDEELVVVVATTDNVDVAVVVVVTFRGLVAFQSDHVPFQSCH